MSVLVKKHIAQRTLILAVCDKSLFGKVYSEKGKQLDLTGEFYNGNEEDEPTVMTLMNQAQIVNLVGEESVNIGIKALIISRDHVATVKNIPHAQSTRL